MPRSRVCVCVQRRGPGSVKVREEDTRCGMAGPLALKPSWWGAQHRGLWSTSWPPSGKEEHPVLLQATPQPDPAAQRLQNDTDSGLVGTESGGSWLAARMGQRQSSASDGWLNS